MSRATWMIASASLFAVVCVAVAAWRAGLLRPRPPDAADVLLERGRTEYATIAVARPTSREALESTLAAATFLGACPPQRQRALLNEVTDFLYFRFAQPSPAVYRQWRKEIGCVPVPLRELLDPWHIDRSHEIFFGEPLPPDADVDALFDKFWEGSAAHEGGFNRLVGIAAEPRGLCCAFGQITRADPRHRPRLAGPMPPDLWYGRVSVTMRRWWRHPRQGPELLEQFARVDCAEFGMVAEFADGSRRPLVLTYLFDPADNRWILEHVVAYNLEYTRASALEY